MTNAILYARYSTALQSQESVEDQFRILRQRAERESWRIVGECADRAISGTVRDRPGLADAMRAIEGGGAAVLVAESLDRISRDQEDLANLFKRVRFAGARIVTLSEGEIGAMHIGMGGTMSAMFLEQLAEKVRRGHVGRVEAGRIPGGLSYGYRAVRAFRADGEPERGLREIDEQQAVIVRRIFAEYADGVSPVETARRLNAEDVPSPRGGLWRTNAITGHRARRNGILYNELYRGRILYNRQSFRKDPSTRKRVSRANAEAELVTGEVPALRIVDEDLWQRAHQRLASSIGKHLAHARRPRRLLSGMLRCACCGGTYVIINSDRWGCSTRQQSRSCDNGCTITNGRLEARIMAAIQRELLHPDVIAAHLDELRIAAAEAKREWIATRAAADRRRAGITEERRKIADAVIAGVDPATLAARSHELAAELAAIDAEPNEFPIPESAIAHPAAVDFYRRQVEQLHLAMADDADRRRQMRAILEPLIEKIEIAPRSDAKRGVDITVHGQLAGMLALNDEKPAKALSPAGECTVSVVAGVGFEPTTFRL